MRRFSIPMLALTGIFALGSQVQAQTVHEVKLIDVSATEFAFSPAALEVAPGDIVRWIYAGKMGQPHNVEFREGGMAGTMSPFMMTEGETYELTIDSKFAAGVTNYVCTPHEFMGMKGTITVKAEKSAGN